MADKNSTPEGASNTGTIDDIAQLLMEGDDDTDETTSNEDSEGVEKLPEESTESDEVEGKDEQNEQDEQSSEEDVTWSKLLGIDDDKIIVDDSGNLKGFIAKIDGVTEEVDIKTMLTNYQTAKYNTQRSQAIVEKERNFEQAANKVAEEYVSKLDTAETLVKLLHSSFVKEFESVDWDTLRTTQPGEYAALVQDMNFKKQQLDSAFMAVTSEKEAERKKSMESESRAMEEFTKKNFEQMLEKNPEWRDNTKRKEVFSKMESFVADTYGFTPNEFNSVRDFRLFELVKDAMAYRKVLNETKVPTITKTLPKFVKSSNAVNTGKSSKLNKLVARAKTSTGASKRSAEIDAVAALLLGD